MALQVSRLACYRKVMLGDEHGLVLEDLQPEVLKAKMCQIRMLNGRPAIVVNEPWVYEGIVKFFASKADNLALHLVHLGGGFEAYKKGLHWREVLCDFREAMGQTFEEILSKRDRPLSDWKHNPLIGVMSDKLVGPIEIVGLKGSREGKGKRAEKEKKKKDEGEEEEESLTLEEFLAAHEHHGSTWEGKSVGPFYFPKYSPSGPDMVFVLRIDGQRLVPFFVQMKVHQNAKVIFEDKGRHKPPTIQCNDFKKYCPDGVYVNMVVDHPSEWTRLMPTRPDPDLGKIFGGGEGSSVPAQEIKIRVDEDNFGDIFPESHVKVIQSLMEVDDYPTFRP